MVIEKIDLLETKVKQLIEALGKARGERDGLSLRLDETVQRLKESERNYGALDEEWRIVRAKIEKILKHLDEV